VRDRPEHDLHAARVVVPAQDAIKGRPEAARRAVSAALTGASRAAASAFAQGM
jgi:hypothetical protein